MSKYSVVYAGGGSGGHLMPGIAVSRSLRELLPYTGALFLTSKRDIEKKILDAEGIEYRSLNVTPMSGGIIGKMRTLLRLPAAVRESARILAEVRARAVVALGGYAGVAPSLAARAMGIPVIVLEQNTVPGKANRLVSRFARFVCGQFSEAREHFPRGVNYVVTGNPVRKSLGRITRREGIETFGLSLEKRTLLITGGSQGASGLNDLVTASMRVLEKRADRVQVIHQCGKADYEDLTRFYGLSSVQSYVSAFVPQMDSAYAAADFAICRAGATTIAELEAVGLPAMLVPIPRSNGDHQMKNAMSVQRSAAGICVRQSEFTHADLARALELTLAETPEIARERAQMAESMRERANPDASAQIADMIFEAVVSEESRRLTPSPLGSTPRVTG
ncbi:MAG: undecaprenyldiphospho-muramoylpentapeptide beta-N-acetylglucosaminyltransferase [Planctomycetes bacterium]|nr:undecaprenyldiphospho-muramoylpentapeptide beta-N-acetylglucosaminyltransferase [Planctomycetota bacterium]